MKYMLLIYGNEEAFTSVGPEAFAQILRETDALNQELFESGELVGAYGVADQVNAKVVRVTGGAPVVTDGPYAEAKELFNGFWIIQVSSKEEAAEWAKRCPLGPGARLEVRRINELEDFPQDNEWIQKEAQWRADAEAGKLARPAE